jgi:excisionase family DNA binding protein
VVLAWVVGLSRGITLALAAGVGDRRNKIKLKYTNYMARAQRVLQLREAADFLGVHYQTAYGWVRQGLLPATKAGRCYRVNVADVHALGAQRAASPGGEGPQLAGAG